MNSKLLKLLKGAFAWCALCGVLTAHAQDKATLDLLVSKGVITQAEADKAAKEAAVTGTVVPRVDTVKKIKIEGMIQGAYDNLYAHPSTNGTFPASQQVAPVSTNQIYFRRVMLGAQADLGNGWGGEIMMDFAATQIADQPKSGLSPQASPTTASTVGGQQGVQYISQNLFDKIAITKQIPDYGTAEIGYDKVNFIQEEITSSGALPAIERSMATRYFDEYYGSPTAYRLAFAQRRTGVFWKGTVPTVDGLYYSAAFTNGIQSNINYVNIGGMNRFGGWVGVGYKNSLANTGLTYDAGINLGYSGDGNSQNGANSGLARQNQANSTDGWEGYLNLQYGSFKLLGDFFQAQFDNGRSTIPFTSTILPNQGITSTATPYGINITPEYEINDDWEAVARFTYLSTNGRGTDQNGVLWNAPNDNAASIAAPTAPAVNYVAPGSLGPLFDDAYAIYLGVNWKVSAGVRFSLGYEWAKFTDRQVYVLNPATGISDGTSNFSGPSTNEGLIRARLQVTF